MERLLGFDEGMSWLSGGEGNERGKKNTRTQKRMTGVNEDFLGVES